MWLWRLVWREFRQRPGRMVGSAVAIVLAVGLLVATQLISATELHASASREAIHLSSSDVVVETHLWHEVEARNRRDAAVETSEQLLAADPDVVAVSRVSRLFTQLTAGEHAAGAMLTSVPTDPALSWLDGISGRAPQSDREIVLTAQSAAQLQVGIGDTVRAELYQPVVLTVVGIAPDRGYSDAPAYVTLGLLEAADATFPPANLAVVIDPASKLHATPGSSGDGVGIQLIAKTRSPAQAGVVAARIQQGLTKAGFMRVYAYAETTAQAQAAVHAQVAARPHVLDAVMAASALASLGICTLLIATTFSVFAAQRRRFGGMLRAIGASRRQLVGLFLAESIVLSVVAGIVAIGAGVGLASAVAWWTGAIHYGLVVPWDRVALAFGLGMVATVVAAVVPAVRFSREPPLAAVSTASRGHGRHRVAAKLQAVVPLRRTSLRLALGNVVRAPGRSLMTMFALALSVALLAAVNVGMATGQDAASRSLDRRYGADLILQSARSEPEVPGNASGLPSLRDSRGLLRPFSPDALPTVRATDGVADAQQFDVTETVLLQNGSKYMWRPVAALDPSANTVLRSPLTVRDGEIGMDPDMITALGLTPGSRVDVGPLTGDQQTLTVAECGFSPELAIVSATTLARLNTPTHAGLIIARLSDQDVGDSVVHRLQARLATTDPGMFTGGSTEPRAALRAQLAGLTAVTTALLAVGIVVALIGISNMLALSVLERDREIAVLRAVGLTRTGVWRSLLTEALLLSTIATIAGVIGGIAVGGWAASQAVTRLHLVTAPLHVNDPIVAIMAMATIMASCCASLSPTRAITSRPPARQLAAEWS